jgi:hypothetical protein
MLMSVCYKTIEIEHIANRFTFSSQKNVVNQVEPSSGKCPIHFAAESGVAECVKVR